MKYINKLLILLLVFFFASVAYCLNIYNEKLVHNNIDRKNIIFEGALHSYNESNETVTMNYWGEITSTGICEVLIEGIYNLNSRVRLYITLIVE